MDQKDDCPYELLFNWGVLQLLTTPDSAARIGLHKLIDSAALSAEKMGEYSDRSTILMNQDILRDIWRPSIATPVKSEFSLKLDEMPETTRTVRDVHREMAQENARRALLLLENEPSAKLIPLQKLLWYYNRAIYQLRTAQYDKCRGTCELLLSYAGLPNPGIQTKKDKRQARSTGLSHSPENQLWWQVRVAVLLAHCSIRNQTEDTNRDLLHSLERLEKTVQQQLPVDSSTRAHLETYLAVHRAAISRKSNNVLTVDGLPENVKKFAAVGAVKQCLCHDLGVTQTAVKPQPSKSDVALADFHYSLGDYELAASLFERVLDEKGDNMVARACWIRALSHTDPKKAIEEWQSSGLSTVNPGNEQHHSFGNEFETQDSLPWWLLQVRKGQRIEALEQNRKKSRGAVARQRNKKREAYIATLEATNGDKASKPDPERWLPKHERVRARRKHGGKIFTSSQGGISEKDAAKLDVVARQAARAAGATEGPSTAHLTVTAAANMRKGKSGKRR
jgi:tetratricopeptide (TPR) repeat protein